MKGQKRIRILTAGGDSPASTPPSAAVGKAAVGEYGWEMIGFRRRLPRLAQKPLCAAQQDRSRGILTVGGTILGTSRDKPHRID